MQTSEKIPAFEQVTQILAQSNAMTGAAETHGLICGFICSGSRLNGKSWIEPVLGFVASNQGKVKPESKDVLINLYDISCRQLQGLEFNFQLLLPDEEHDLAVRAEALSHWCNGYLAGLGLAGLTLTEDNSEDVHDALRRLSEIAKLDFENIETREEDKLAYIEVMEYVRMAVLLLYSELADKQGTAENNINQAPKSGNHNLLH